MSTKKLKLLSLILAFGILFTACDSGNKIGSPIELLEHYRNNESVVGMTIDVEVTIPGPYDTQFGGRTIFAQGFAGSNLIKYYARNPGEIGNKETVTLKITEVEASMDAGAFIALDVTGDIV